METRTESIRRKIRTIDPIHPQSAVIDEAVEILKSGGVILFPTSGLYGLAADALNSEAVSKVFRIKQRPAQKPLLVLIESIGQARFLVKEIPHSAERIIKKFWPGRVTLILEAASGVSSLLTAGTGKIGLRVPGHPVAQALVRKTGNPITGTSANLSGRPGCKEIIRLDIAVADQVDLILDAGILLGGVGSTVVDATSAMPVVIREGTAPADEIFRAIEP